jgi:hypothetical protein
MAGTEDDEDDETEVDEVDIRNHCKRAEVYSLDATVFQRFGNGERRDGSV